MTLRDSDHVVVVGAGLAGWRVCEYLRRAGFRGALTLVGGEDEAPYDRPPLSKQVLTGKWEVEKTTLSHLVPAEEMHLEYLQGDPAVSCDQHTHSVTLASGRVVSGTHLIIATGVEARRWSSDPTLPTVRSRHDVRELSRDINQLPDGDHVVVIGGGFIGAEVATSLTTRGFRVTVLEAAPLPLVGPLGDTAAAWLANLPERAGVALDTSIAVSAITRSDGRFLVSTSAGAYEAGLVIVGIGAVPATQWLEGSGLPVEDGVVVDHHLEVTNTIAAIGDVAKFHWRHPRGDDHIRIEHWQVANDHALALAEWWVNGTEPEVMVPYFWSDQYGVKIQMLGHPHRTDAVHMVHGSVEEGKWLALYEDDRGFVSGILTLSQPRALMVSKVLLDTATTLHDAMALAPWAS